MVNSSILMLRQNKFLSHWPLEEIRKAKPKDFRLQYFRKGTIITSSRDSIRKLAFVKKVNHAFNLYRQHRPKMDASIFDSALSHTGRSESSEKEEKIACPLLDVFSCGQVSSHRLYRLSYIIYAYLLIYFY